MANVRKTLRKWHLWLGWLVGVPILFWTASGFFMVLKPIEEVRGEHLLREAAPLSLASAPILPEGLDAAPVEGISLQQRASGPVWVVALEGATRIADPATGEWLDPYGANDAAAEVMARYEGGAALDKVEAVDTDNPPGDWRRQVPAWQVAMDDGTRFYVERDTGRIAATRTGWWRAFDFMWGLHIMDLQTREDFNNNWLRIFAAFSVLATLMALVLLPLATNRKKKGKR